MNIKCELRDYSCSNWECGRDRVVLIREDTRKVYVRIGTEQALVSADELIAAVNACTISH
jgi:hypothetical protein